MRGTRALLQLLLLLLLVLICSVKAQISKPIAHDKNFQESVANNKFLSRQATDDLLGYPNLDEEALANTQCPRHVELRWQTEVSSSIYATPLIADINADGKLDIVVPSFVHYLDVLEGADGEKVPGWPVFHQSIVHSSPLLYDIDKDGLREILLPTYNGEILVFRSSGYLLSDKMTVPRLRVRKDWHVGLNPDHVDRSQPDIHDESLVPHPPMTSGNDTARGTEVKNKSTSIAPNIPVNSSAVVNSSITDNTSIDVLQNVNKTMEKAGGVENTTTGNVPANAKVNDVASAEGISGTTSLEIAAASLNQTHDARMQGALRRLFQESVEKTIEHATNSEQNKVTVENKQEALDQDAEASFDVFRDQGGNDLTDEYNYDYDDYVDESMWGDEEWHEAQHEKEEDYINIDAHILCTPVIADIDKDGVDEMVVATSFFFDREYYETPEHAAEIGNIDIGKYVAGAIVVFNLETKQVKWKTHLDLSTDSVSFRAYIYSSPTVVDLDGNGNLSIIVGTSLGFVYALHNNGSVRTNFPLQMGEIQAQVIAADINDDGKVEIVTADTRGNVAAWTPEGKELWEVHLKSLIAQAPTVGDVNGDGKTDVVIPTVSGNIYVLKGTDGSTVPPFPFRTHGRIMSSVLLVDLSSRDAEQTGLTLVTTSFDGYMYLIDGKSGCADATDIGETTYSMVLAENVDGGDDLDLIVSTMNGNVYCFQTPAPHYPSKSWPMQAHGRNVMSVRHNREGVFALPSSRTYRDEAGDSFWVVFKIVDQHGLQGPYNVTVTLLVPGNYQGPKRIAQWKLYDQPGVQKMKLPCVSVRTTGTVSIEMVDKHGFYFWDEFALTFHMHYYRLLKWMVMLPMLGLLAAQVLLNPRDRIALPSFSSDRHQS